MTGQLQSTGPLHTCTYRVLYGDTDSGGVVYYGNYMRLFERGRTEMMRELGLPYSEIEAQGLILPVVECYARYKASAKYDDLLAIQTVLTEVKKVSCAFSYRICRVNENKLLVKGTTTHAVVNRDGKLTKFPEEILKKLQAVIGNNCAITP